jgi:hypothetical protein
VAPARHLDDSFYANVAVAPARHLDDSFYADGAFSKSIPFHLVHQSVMNLTTDCEVDLMTRVELHSIHVDRPGRIGTTYE